MARYTLSVTFETNEELTEADVNRLGMNTIEALERQRLEAGFTEDEAGGYVQKIDVTRAEQVL